MSWNAQDVKYTFRGGNVAVEATLTGGVKDNDASAKVDVTVRINNSKVQSVATVTGNELFKNNNIVIDPFANTNVFARKSGYNGDRYEKSPVATSGYVKNNLDGTYKLVDGKYVELTKEELNRDYANFPTQLTINLAGNKTATVPVVWDFSGVNVTYAGGEYTAYAIVNYGGEYNYGTNEVGTQRIRFTVRVLDRSVVSIADESALKALVGYANGTNSGVEQYVNPYEYVKPTMPTELKFNERTGNGDETQVVTYKTKGDESRILVWSFDEFRPTYNGGLIYVTAKLIGVDGNVQSYKIPFLVKKMIVKEMTSATTTKSGNSTVLKTTDIYTSFVDNSLAKTSFVIDPNDPSKLTMPFAYIVTFGVSTPEFDATTGKIKLDEDGKEVFNAVIDETLDFFYAIVSMPADTSYTVKSSGITTNADGKSAIVQLADQERISVGIKQINSSIAPTGITADSLRSGSTLKTVATVSSVKLNVVWFGTAYVYASNDPSRSTPIASYAVMFTSVDSARSFTLPTSSNRKITYKLRAAVGVVVDNNGTVITSKVATSADAVSGVVKAGQTIPDAQFVTDTVSIEI